MDGNLAMGDFQMNDVDPEDLDKIRASKNFIVLYEDGDDNKHYDRTNCTLDKITEHAMLLKEHDYKEVEVYEVTRVW